MRIAELKRQLEQAEGKSYIIIARARGHFDEAIALAQAASEPRNISARGGAPTMCPAASRTSR